METPSDMMNNIAAKEKAAALLREKCPSEASYLAGYCLECLLKCTYYCEQKKPWPSIHRKDQWLDRKRLKLESDSSRLSALLDNFNNALIFNEWQAGMRYIPSWVFTDLEVVFDKELPEILQRAKKLKIDFLGAFK